jgi:hypothetical protein
MILNSAPSRVERIDVPKDPETGNFRDFPNVPALAAFDPSDRIFVATARRSGAPVANAVDSDWLVHERVLADHGVAIDFVCGRDAARRSSKTRGQA